MKRIYSGFLANRTLINSFMSPYLNIYTLVFYSNIYTKKGLTSFISFYICLNNTVRKIYLFLPNNPYKDV